MWDERIIQYWANQIGLDASAFVGSGISVHFLNTERPNLTIYRLGERTMVLLPTFAQARVQAIADTLDMDSDEGIIAAFNMLSPTFRYTDPIYFWRGDAPILNDPAIRILTHDDAALFDELQAACSEEDRDLAEITIADFQIMGYFIAGKLVAVTSLLVENEHIVDVGVLTHPDYRGRGFSVALTQVLTAWALSQGKIVQYTSQYTNPASMKVAEKSGFTLFMTETAYTIQLSMA